ncbi:hypothetical protein WICPIJ_003182 [Wickerhamomyces pijperi]|uniref:Peptidase M16 middle/third domain-containing protein n=1 Tax=Wickerhamomyces pijperi TaxID=599730 RepID=A0A9P8QA25_WICPI|nr:hypothetical protein WICPIJ_003182 [Wickerhamomyces pijperi]
MKDQLNLPKPNPFIPTDFKVTKAKPATPETSPILLVNEEDFRFCYNAELAGLSFSISTGKEGIVVDVTGYSQKASVLLQTVLTEMFQFVPTEERFNVIKERILRNYKNLGYKVPYSQITSVFANLVNECSWDTEDRLAALENIAYSDLLSFIPLIFKQTYIEGLIHENGRFIKAISNGYCDFTHNEKESAILETITKTQLSKFYQKVILSSESPRLNVNLNALGGTDSETVEGFPAGLQIKDSGSFKSTLFLTPSASPVEEISNFSVKL